MSMNYPAIATHIIASKGVDIVDDTLLEKESTEDILQDIRNLLKEAHEYFMNRTIPEIHDIFKIVTLYKDTIGPEFIPNPEKRQFIRIFSGVSTPLTVKSVLGTFLLTIPPATWTSLDLPDGTVFQLDVTAPSNFINVYIRYTNDKP